MFAQNENSRSRANRSRWRRAPSVWLLISIGFTNACGSGGGSNDSEDVSSAILATADLEVAVSIIAPGDGSAEVALDLDTASPDSESIELTDADRFEVSHGTSSRRLQRDFELPNPRYLTTFKRTSPMDAFALRFHRADDVVVDLPLIALQPEFDITSPEEDDSFTFEDTISIEWAPARPGSEIELTIYSSCALIGGGTGSRARTRDIEDDGTESFDLSTLSRADDPDIDQSQPCRLFLQFDRETETEISPPFASGSRVKSTQRRRLDIPLRF
jgi:hypothetical protein